MPSTWSSIPGGDGRIRRAARHHAPLISTIRPGIIDVHDGASIAHRIFVGGGFVEVLPDRCTVLAEDAVMVTDIDRAQVEADLAEAELTLRDAESDHDRRRAEGNVARLGAMLEASRAN